MIQVIREFAKMVTEANWKAQRPDEAPNDGTAAIIRIASNLRQWIRHLRRDKRSLEELNTNCPGLSIATRDLSSFVSPRRSDHFLVHEGRTELIEFDDLRTTFMGNQGSLFLVDQHASYQETHEEEIVLYHVDADDAKEANEFKEDVGREVKSEIDASPCVAFSDANWADSGDPKLRSTSGYCIYVFGCLISWSTKRQTLTAASTMQAELIAAATCADEVKWFYNILSVNEEIFGAVPPIPLYVDNSAALAVSNHPKMTPQSKFIINLREFRIRDYQQEGILRPLWIPTKLNVADGFTKTW